MSTALDVVSAVLLLAGALLAVTAAVGLLRFPDTLARMHAATKPQTLGLLLVLAGTAIRLRGGVDVGMLVLAGLFQLLTAPVIGHRLGRLAYRERSAGAVPFVVDELAQDEAVDQAGAPSGGGPARRWPTVG